MFKKLIVMLLFSLWFFGYAAIDQAEAAERLDGKDRFEVAVKVSEKGWPNGSETVILANYLAFADALAATPYAYWKNAPVLLTQPGVLTEATKAEIQRLKPAEVILIGGEGSLNPSLIVQIKQAGVSKITRINGKNRFEVAKNIAIKMPPSNSAVISYGLNFPDALAIAPYAARNGYPILLTNKDTLPKETREALTGRKVGHTLVSGGEGSVSAKVFSQLPAPQRVGGKDRFEVAKNIFQKYNRSSTKVYIANGLTFADALTGSVMAAKENASILLTWPTRLPDATQNVLIDRMVNNVLILGGTGSVNNNIIYLAGKWEMKNWAGYGLSGYTSSPSVFPGQSLTFYINSDQPYHLEFYRMGYYGGKGGLLKGTKTGLPAQIQRNKPNPETLDARWNPSLSYKIPLHWDSGFYVAKVVRKDKKASFIPFVVKEQSPSADFTVLIATNTYHAYNNWGGKSLYGYNSSNKEAAVKLSFNRPYKNYFGAGEFFSYEYNLIRWLEKKGYRLTYVTDSDVHNGLLNTTQAKNLIIAGHDEYWTKRMRDNIESLPSMDLALFNANIGYWQIRLEDGGRTMVSYKARAAEDPFNKIDPSQVTTQFRMNPVNRAEENLFGTMYRGIPEKTMPMIVSNSSHWIYNGTGLKDGDKINGVVGGEVDASMFTENVEYIARSPVVLYGKEGYSDVIWYNHPDGRKVFSAGSFYWNWFLDPYGHTDKASYNKNIEIMTTNALDRLKLEN
ncbi:N,N-dimethylformamidase beta subunit family domain-containing protein [Bacillus sp. REN3]|uniref:N,N-dimethylformamidase beta subunit family domain-containing protein n=1 Tax=Bacillus sp. REN3 TaxID=2802440 RepID=UPI001AED315F|nr:N,N-dimethylformamidase beta subunit family domain-containing protein [Bacillus sp. REN3]